MQPCGQGVDDAEPAIRAEQLDAVSDRFLDLDRRDFGRLTFRERPIRRRRAQNWRLGPFAAIRGTGFLEQARPQRRIVVSLADRRLTVEREIGGGARQVLELDLPCVISATRGLNEPRYASLKGIMAAKKKPIESVSAADLGLPAPAARLTARPPPRSETAPTRRKWRESVFGSSQFLANRVHEGEKQL